MDELQPHEDGSKEDVCPAMGGVFFMPLFTSPRVCCKEKTPTNTYTSLSASEEFTINAVTPSPSPRMKEIMEGIDKPGDSGNPPDLPPWLDRQLFNRGRQFYKRYIFCLSFSDLLSLILMFSQPRALRPLIFTGRSDSSQKALQRYFSTLLHVITWYKGDVWDPNDPAHKDVISIRSGHNKVARLFNSSYNNERVTNVKVSDRGYEEPTCPLYTSIQQDMRPLSDDGGPGLLLPSGPPLYISQFDMSITQYSFMGLLVAHPKNLGAGAATEEEFESLIHFWRGIGWLLGIEDKYNFCNGNLVETRNLCLEVERLIAIPSLAAADWNYEHMSTCLMKGINTVIPCLSFPAMFRYLADLMEVPVLDFASRMSFVHTVHYWTLKFIFSVILIIPGLVLVLNSMLENMIEKVQKQSSKDSHKSKVKLTKNIYT